MTYYLKYLLITKLHVDAILYSNLGKENSDVGPIKCSRGPLVLHPWSTVTRTGKRLRGCPTTWWSDYISDLAFLVLVWSQQNYVRLLLIVRYFGFS